MTAGRTILTFNQLFRELRKSYDFSRLSLGGVNMWPIVRLAGFYQHEARVDQLQMPLLSTASNKFAGARGGGAKRPVTHENLADAVLIGVDRAEPVDVLALQTDREVGPAGAATAFSAGLETLSGSAGLSLANLTSFSPRLTSHLSNRQWLYVARPRAAMPNATEYLRWHSAVSDLCSQFNKGAGGEILHAAHVSAHAQRLLSLIDASRSLLDRFAPKLLFTNGAFGIEKMAMIAAARQRGIVCVDHQHGMYGAGSETFLSPLGAQAACVDPTPDIAWVWSEWFHRNYVGDPKIMPRIVGGSMTGGFAVQARAAQQTGASGSAKTVLYLHQGLVSAYDPSIVPFLPQKVFEAIRRSPEDWKWLVRLHPRWAGSAERADGIAREVLPVALSQRISFEHPSQMTLTECFQASDCVLTGFSASACLAHDFGLPVVIHHAIGRDLFEPAIEERRVVLAQEPDAILEALARGAPSPKSELFVRHDLDLSRKAIMELWQMAQARTLSGETR